MVLWEITVATAYFLGFKRTYRLALRIQKSVIGPNHPKTRQFLHRRIRSVFDVAVRVQQNIQKRDLEVGRNLGNRILRWLENMKPPTNIRACQPPEKPFSKINSNIAKHLANSRQLFRRPKVKPIFTDFKGKLFFSPLSVRPKSFPTIAMMMQPMRPAGMNGRYRQFSHFTTSALSIDYRLGSSKDGIFRRDIALWMQQK